MDHLVLLRLGIGLLPEGVHQEGRRHQERHQDKRSEIAQRPE